MDSKKSISNSSRSQIKDPLEAKFEEDLQKAIALSMESAAMDEFKKNKPICSGSGLGKMLFCFFCFFFKSWILSS